MPQQRWLTLAVFFIMALLPWPALPADAIPDLMMATRYHPDIDVRQYLVSEKLDGVRARWDGTQLFSRGGNVFAAPTWFTKHFPNTPLDGELWIGRGQYEDVSSVVRKHTPHEGWELIRFMIFDLPQHHGPFEQRMNAMRLLVEQAHSPYLTMIPQENIASEEALRQQFQTIIEQGGEGLMLHKKTAHYASGRSQDLLKLKPFTDAEATVIGYRPGKGQFAGLVGSLKVQTDEGVVFYVGSGLTHEHRRHPPPIHSRITFRYQGFTKNGVPRFPVFLHIRHEEPE
ncbi:MAG: DNA ligase [Nitrospirales bacterium]|nr:DNA ligase [Nitrospirales bacterium]